MWKSCARCGRIHDTKYPCKKIPVYNTRGPEAKLRATYAWAEKSKAIRKKAGYLCEVCRDKDERYVYDNIEVHHINPLKAAPEQLLDDYNLICLCQEHHKKAEAGEISKEYLRALAYRREELFTDDNET